MSLDSHTLLQILSRLRQQKRESGTFEFKSNWDIPADIGEYISALANAAALENHDRAWMVWGVDNQTHAVTGTAFDPFAAKAEGNQPLIMYLAQKTFPKADFEFYEVPHPDGRVVMLEIYPARSGPIAFSGVRYIRIDSHKSPLAQYQDKEARLWASIGDANDWTGETVPEASIDDLDPQAIKFAREKFVEYLIRNEIDSSRHEIIRAEAAAWDIATLLNKARVTKQGKVTRSALLLLGKDESAHFLSPADIKITWILRDENNTPVTSQHFGMPLLLASDAVFKRIRNVVLEHMPDGTLFPTPVYKYDSWVIREAMHNCIAHQDYKLGGKVNVVEHPDRLIFTNLGAFIPESVEWMLEHQSPPEHYRNQWLIDGMVRLRMIDQIGSGIRRMFQTQRDRLFPLPDYTFDTERNMPRVEVAIAGRVVDSNYAQILMRRPDLTLHQVLLLDRVQKKQNINADDAKRLKAEKLIEGRYPAVFISSKVSEWTSQKASYIHNRALDDAHYKKLIVQYLVKYKKASRADINELLVSKLSDALDADQKLHKVKNLLQTMRRDGIVENAGTRAAPVWVLSQGGKSISKLDAERRS